jgi:Spy/CpxP family protein refolding chaperone
MRLGILASTATVALGLLFTPALSAQTPGGGQRGPGRMQAMALQGITLTPSQQSKVDSITAKTRAQMPAMTPGTPPSDADRQKMMSLSTASLKEIRTVLTPDQQAIYDKNVAAIQQQMQQRMQGGATPATPATPGAQGAPATPAQPAAPAQPAKP